MEPVILINHKTVMTKGSQTQNNKQHTQYMDLIKCDKVQDMEIEVKIV